MLFTRHSFCAIPMCDIVLYETEKGKGANGWYDRETNTVYLDIFSGGKGEQAMLRTFSHELTHYMQEQSPESYARYKSFILDYYYGKDGGILLERLLEQERRLAPNKNREYWEDEVVANASEMFLNDEAAMRTLIGEQPSTAKVVDQWLKRMTYALRRAFKGVNATEEAAKELEANIEYFEEAQKRWNALLKESIENSQGSATSEEQQFSIRKVVGESGKDYGMGVYLDSTLLENLSDKERVQMVKARIAELGGQTFIAYDGNVPVKIKIEQNSKKFINSKNKKMQVNKDLLTKNINRNIKQESVVLSDEIIATSEYTKSVPSQHTHGWLDNYGKSDWEKRSVFIQEKNNSVWKATLQIANASNGEKILYDIDPIKMVEGTASPGKSPAHRSPSSTTAHSVHQNSEDVNTQFSMRKPVEETGDLIAVHNISESKLESTLKLGGFPMPSIAIVKAEQGHSEFGDISVVFGKDTIDPKFIKSNEVYGADAWTPTYPKIEYKANGKAQKRLRDKHNELAHKLGYKEALPLYNYATALEDVLNDNGGEAEMKKRILDDTQMMNLFLQDIGKEKVQNIEKEIRTEISEADRNRYNYLINELGENIFDEMKTPDGMSPMAYRKAFIKKYESQIKEAYGKYLSENFGFTEEDLDDFFYYTTTADLLDLMTGARNYIKNGAVTVKTEVDRAATNEAIKKAAENAGYAEWVEKTFSGAEEKSGIRNNKDAFTPQGNRRSFESLHWENNLENVVKAMKEEQKTGGGFFGAQQIWGVSARKYSSIAELKADEARLQNLSDEEYNKIKQEFGERLESIAQKIKNTNENPFIAIDNAYENIADAVRSRKTKTGILNYLKQYGMNATMQDVDKIVSLVADIAEMPTQYFEAKPRRAVGFDEVKAVVLPDTASEKLKQSLSNAGINVVEYSAGDSESRLDALNSLENVKFSKRKSLDSFNAKEYNEVKLGKQEYARLSAAIGTEQPNARGIVTQVLDNENGEPAIIYTALVSNDKLVVLHKKKAKYTDEKRNAYANGKSESIDTNVGEFRNKRSNNSGLLGIERKANGRNDGISGGVARGGGRGDGRRSNQDVFDSGEESREHLTVSDLEKIQYQLRKEDENRLYVLERQEERLTNDLKILEKAYGKVIRQEYEQNIKPNDKMSRRAAEINRKAANRFMNEVGAVFHVAKEDRRIYLLPIINEIIDKGPTISDSRGLIENLYRTAYERSSEYAVGISDKEYNELRKYIKKTAVFVDAGTRADVGDYGNFVKNNFGRLRLTKDATALGLDEFYDELRSIAPEDKLHSESQEASTFYSGSFSACLYFSIKCRCFF